MLQQSPRRWPAAAARAGVPPPGSWARRPTSAPPAPVLACPPSRHSWELLTSPPAGTAAETDAAAAPPTNCWPQTLRPPPPPATPAKPETPATPPWRHGALPKQHLPRGQQQRWTRRRRRRDAVCRRRRQHHRRRRANALAPSTTVHRGGHIGSRCGGGAEKPLPTATNVADAVTSATAATAATAAAATAAAATAATAAATAEC